jgi:hypothetical protein
VIRSVSIRIWIRFACELSTSISLMHIAFTSSEALFAHRCNNISKPLAFMNLYANSTGLAHSWSDFESSRSTLINFRTCIWKHGQDFRVKLWVRWSISDSISLPPEVNTHSNTPAIGSRYLSTSIGIVAGISIDDSEMWSGPLKSS